MRMLLVLSFFIVQLTSAGVDRTVTRTEAVKVTSVKSPIGKWSCPPRSKFSKIGYDEPFCKIGDKLIQVKGTNLPKGYGCFRCVPKSNTVKPLLMDQ